MLVLGPLEAAFVRTASKLWSREELERIAKEEKAAAAAAAQGVWEGAVQGVVRGRGSQGRGGASKRARR
jgi:hypothetical protein